MTRAHNEALQVFQQSILVLANWVGATLSYQPEFTLMQAKQRLSGLEETTPRPLRVLFDHIHLSQREPQQHYWEPKEIEDENIQIPYPQDHVPDLEPLKERIRATLEQLDESDWQNFPLLMLIVEKFASYISFGDEDVAFFDLVRSTAAIAAALASTDSNSEDLSLIAGDLSGIQKFIYTISSDGALKSLRARSFYLELVAEEVVQQLLKEFKLPRANVIYAGGGKLYILAGWTAENQDKLKRIRQNLNQWLFEEFQGKVFLALDEIRVKLEEVESEAFDYYWSKVTTEKIARQKSRKFAEQFDKLKLLVPEDAYEPCGICHRDDVENLEELRKDDGGSIRICGTCKQILQLGGQLPNTKVIVRSKRSAFPNSEKESIAFGAIFYHLLSQMPDQHSLLPSETVFLINNWEIEKYKTGQVFPFLIGNYAQKSKIEKNAFMRAGEMAKKAKGIKRLGYLRMDVDRLGQIFAVGLGDGNSQNLPRRAGLSRLMSYFFKVYLNSLADRCEENVFNVQPLREANRSSRSQRKNLVFIYAGGDDLFISGAWNEIVEFAFDVYQSFRAYTGYNPDITLSGGITLASIKFPLYKAAEESGNAEEAAKANGRDSLGLFGEVFKWDEWLGKADISRVTSQKEEYWNSIVEPPERPELFGVMPFVAALEEQQIGVEYSRSFVRNLLITAQLQEQKIKEITEKQQRLEQYNNEIEDIRYYLHLPKVAYTLARLPREVFQNDQFRKSLKNPYNAPYFRAIATWLDLLNRSSPSEEEA